MNKHKASSSILLGCVIFILSLGCSKQANAEKEEWSHNQKIRSALLKNYDKAALPHLDANGTTSIEVNMYLSNIWIDEDTQILTVYSLMNFVWTDDRLKWDYKDYGGLKMAHFGDGEIWKPDFTVYNNAETSDVDHYNNVHFLVYDDGQVVWIPLATFQVVCPMDLTLWPFDQHTCKIIVGSWSAHGWQLDFKLGSNSSEIQPFYFNAEVNIWKIVMAKQERVISFYACCPEPYITIVYTFKLKRNSPTYATTVVVPAIIFPLFLLLQFILPVDHPKRLSIGFVSTFLIFLELLFLKLSLPKLGTSVPLIVSYYALCLFISVLTVVLSAVLGRLVHSQDPMLAFPPPELLKRIFTGPVATILCLRDHANKVGLSGKITEDGEVLEANKPPSYSHEWLLVAKIIDRVCFIFLVTVFVFSLIGYVSPVK